MRAQTSWCITTLGALLLLSRPALPQGASLERVETLLENGQTQQARAALAEWKQTGPGNQASAARAAYLNARLETRATEAEDFYLTIALNHPTSPYAAESLLRLGQARLAAGDAKQAAVYLQRLLADYPRSEHRGLGSVWLARALAASGRTSEACATIDAAPEARPGSEAGDLLRAEQRTACPAAPGARAAADATSRAPVPAARNAAAPSPAPAETRAPARKAAASTGKYTIQVAAFRARAGARATAQQLERAGFSNARLVTVPENALIRVRIGKFDAPSEATAQQRRLRAAGFAAVIVSDALRETPLRN